LRSPATQPEEEESIGALFAQLIDDAGTAVRAELNLYRTTALSHLVRARLAMIFAAVAVLLAQASVTALLVALAWGLARWLGPVGAGLAVAFAGLAISALLLRAAMKRFRAAAAGFTDKPAEVGKQA
jgi:divalent metal cation (Fe/Co/Zn/Cd) transporter